MKDELPQRLYEHLKAAFPDKNVTYHRRNDCVRLEGSTGCMLICHEAFGHQFYGDFYHKRRKVTLDLIVRAAELGLRTQFMYGSAEKAPGIFKQLEFVASSA